MSPGYVKKKNMQRSLPTYESPKNEFECIYLETNNNL